MKTILHAADYAEIRQRIGGVSEANIRQWGKMNVQQMLVHCTLQLKLAVGEIPSKAQGTFLLRTRLIKWISLSNFPWPKGAVTANEMDVVKNNFLLKGIEFEKKELLDYLEKAHSLDQLQPHPLFGHLSRKEWLRLIYKHLDHHLKQFNS